MQFIDRHFPLIFCSLIVFPLPAALLLGACSSASTEAQEAAALERQIKEISEDMITLSPRPGVECYILKSHSVSVPRVMSCVALPVMR